MIRRSKNALNFFNAAGEHILYLSGRWSDESQHENIDDYKTPTLVEIAARHKVVIVKMNKRPFGCEFKVDGRTYRLNCNRSIYEYQRIA